MSRKVLFIYQYSLDLPSISTDITLQTDSLIIQNNAFLAHWKDIIRELKFSFFALYQSLSVLIEQIYTKQAD